MMNNKKSELKHDLGDFGNNKVNSKTTKKLQNKIGGLALFNGIVFRSENRESSATRNSDNSITVDVVENVKLNNVRKPSIKNIPIIRGLVNVYRTIHGSFDYILASSENLLNSVYVKKNTGIDADIKIEKNEFTISYIIAIIIILSFCILIPNLLSLLVPLSMRNIVQFSIQISFVAIYLLVLKKTSLLKEIFMYHGAEHKTINAYEKLGTYNLKVEDVMNSNRFHSRCGGNLLVYFLCIYALLTIFMPSGHILIKSIVQIGLLPLILGISYEIVMLISKLPAKFKFIGKPAGLIQCITTIEPTYEQCEIAIYGLTACVSDNLKISINEYIRKYIENMKKESIDFEYNLNDIYRIIASILDTTQESVFLEQHEKQISFNEQIKIDKSLNRLYKDKTPLQYILGFEKFYNEEYIVNENVLIPRADTEILVEKAIYYIDKYNLENCIDMCTGSGCVGISIAKNSNISEVTLVDISKEALLVALKNIEKNIEKNIPYDGSITNNKVRILTSNLFEEVLKIDTKYDIIVSNPPYIQTAKISSLDAYVQNEPILALDGGDDGCRIYENICRDAKLVLKDNGFLMFEIGYDILEEVKKIINKHTEYEIIECIQDLGNNDRVVICRFLQQ